MRAHDTSIRAHRHSLAFLVNNLCMSQGKSLNVIHRERGRSHARNYVTLELDEMLLQMTQSGGFSESHFLAAHMLHLRRAHVSVAPSQLSSEILVPPRKLISELDQAQTVNNEAALNSKVDR